MRRSPIVGLVLLLSCSSGTAPRATSTLPSSSRLIARHIALVGGTARVLRVGFDPAAGFAQMRVDVEPVALQFALCPLRGLDDPIRLADCDDSVSGVREDVQLDGMRAIAVVLHGTAATANFTLEYDEGGRGVSLRLPSIPPPVDAQGCADNGCNPFFELVPTRTGSFAATARWTGARATLVLLQGSVLGRSQTATGLPYYEAARADGPSPLRIATQTTAPGEYALAIRTEPGAGVLADVAIDATWP